ncbi:MAG: prepilin-type N-terminal cleavage/methylation domain-containing protein, partial [Candidatus Pacebacteria bacterium]|nr:prepilin-type N-terminal cleavage/methylation domain-containing protein [Candidatus Paceibacterota bacterium]
MSNYSKGFTLLEMIIVVAVIGIIASIVYVNFMSDSDYQAKLTKSKAFATSVPLSLPTSFTSEWKFDGPTVVGQLATDLDLADTWSSYDNSATSYPVVRDVKDCVYGKCLDFDGSNSIISKSVNSGIVNGKGNWTASFWIRPIANSGDSCFYSEGVEPNIVVFKLCVGSSDYLKLSLYNTSLKEYTIPDYKVKRDKWNHILLTMKDGDSASGVLSVWLNGDAVYSVNQQKVNYPSTTIKQFIGSGVLASNFKGLIDDIQIYSDYFDQSAPAPVDPGFSSKPSLSVVASGATKIDITYSVPAGAAKTVVERTWTPSKSWEQTAGGSFSDEQDIVPSTNYCYRAKSCNGIGDCSDWTSNQCATTPPNPPAIPSGLSCVLTSFTDVNCIWNSITDAIYYDLQREVPSLHDYNNLTGTSQLDSSLECNKVHSYKVRACNTGGCSSYSSSVSVTTGACSLVTPGSFTCTPTSTTSINCSWGAVSGVGVKYFFERTSPTSQVFPDTTSLSHNDTSLTCGTPYSYRVKACSGNVCSSSATASATTNSCAPSAPTGFSCTASSGTAINCSWTGSAGAATYELQRNSTTIQNTSATSRADSGLTCGIGYTYQVRAVNAGGYSSWVTTSPATTTTSTCAPSAPTGFSCTASSGTAINCSWTGSAGAATYELQRNSTTIQ